MKSRAFTLIELLIVIVIVAILATLTIVALNGIRAKSRDAKRISDIRQIQLVLEMYKNDNNVYPASLTAGQPLVDLVNNLTYLKQIPAAPGRADGSCADDSYEYTPDNSNTSYHITYCLGGAVQSAGPADCTAVPGQICLANSVGSVVLQTPNHVTKAVNGQNGFVLTNPTDLAVGPRYAYILNSVLAGTTSIEIIDLQDKNAPAHVGTLYNGQPVGLTLIAPNDIFLSGSNLFVTCPTDDSLQILSLTNPAAPTFVGEYVSSANIDYPEAVFVSGNYAYVANSSGTDGVSIINVSTRAFVAKMSNGSRGFVFNNPNDVFVDGNYAYITSRDNNSLVIANLTTSTPTHESTVSHNGSTLLLDFPTAVAVSGGYAYVTSRFSSSLQIINVSNPASPVAAGNLVTTVGGIQLQWPTAIQISGNHAYITNSNSSVTTDGLHIVNVANPNGPYFAGNLLHGQENAAMWVASGVAISGNYAIVTARGVDSLEIVDISN